MTYSISPKHLSIDEVAHIMSSGAHLELSPESVALIKQCREYLDRKIETSERPIYGVTTGFG